MQRTLSRYVLLEQVGSAGLATIYRAQEPQQEREVALKVLRPYLCADSDLMERFSEEMERVSRLNHPNILPVYGAENEGGVYWVSMQYVSWPTLRQWIQQPIPVTQALMIFRQIAEAVEAAYSQGISHGDIKPGNIFLDPDTGRVVLSDFGTVILGEGASPGMRTALNTPLPTYSAPERGQGSPPNLRSDIYSLGVLLYDMLTGTAPFNALDRVSVQAKQAMSAPTPPSDVNPNVPSYLNAVILKALTPHPEGRYETPQEFVKALAEVTPAQDVPSAPFTVVASRDLQGSLPGIEPPPAALEEEGPPIICTVCGQTNSAGREWCMDCWSVLGRVAAAPGQVVIPTEERQRRWRRNTRLIKAALGSVVAAVALFTAVQILDIRAPLATPASAMSSISGPGEWAMIHRTYGGPIPVPGERSDFSEGQVKWTFKASDAIVSTPAVKGGRVYVTTHDRRIVALDAATGDLIWEQIDIAPIDSSPAVTDDMLFYGSRGKRVIALDADTGEFRWEFVAEANPTMGSAIVEDGVVYIGSGDENVYALDALTGEEIWRFATLDWITNTPALSDDKLVVSSMDGRVTIYDTDTGKRRFASRIINRSVVGSPIIVEDSIYVPYRDGRLISINLNETEFPLSAKWFTLKTQLYVWALMGHPGLPKGFNWSARLGGTILTTPAVDGDTLFVSTQEGRLMAVDRHTGDRLWVYKTDGKSLSTPTIVDDLILVGDRGGVLHAVDSSTGVERWTLPVAEHSLSTPVVAGGTLYLASKDGTLYAVE